MTTTSPKSLYDTIVADTAAGMARRLFAIRTEIVKLEEERTRVTAQAEWIEAWTHDPMSDEFKHRDGHTLSAAVVRADGTAWPFLQLWYQLQEAAE